jgi:hypothetical protein
MSRLIDVRKLVAVDMAVLGSQVSVSAFALGIVLPFLFGVFSLVLNFMHPTTSGWQVALGFWLVFIAMNYVPLFVYALSIIKGGTVRQEAQPELGHVSRYGAQQAIILVPLLVVALALVQERQRRQAVS